MSRTTDIADAVVERLNAASLGFVAERRWVDFPDTGDATDPRVVVVPSRAEWANAARASRTVDTTVSVVLRRSIADGPATPEEQVDEVIETCESIAANLAGENLGQAVFIGLAQEPLWSPDHYEQHHEVLATIEVTYRSHVP